MKKLTMAWYGLSLSIYSREPPDSLRDTRRWNARIVSWNIGEDAERSWLSLNKKKISHLVEDCNYFYYNHTCRQAVTLFRVTWSHPGKDWRNLCRGTLKISQGICQIPAVQILWIWLGYSLAQLPGDNLSLLEVDRILNVLSALCFRSMSILIG